MKAFRTVSTLALVVGFSLAVATGQEKGTVRFFDLKEDEAFKGRIDAVVPSVLKQLKQGDQVAFLQYWVAIDAGYASVEWKVGHLENMAEALDQFREAEQAGTIPPSWVGTFEAAFASTRPELFGALEALAPLAPAHAFQAIASGKGAQVSAWYAGLPPEHQEIYFSALKHRNALLYQLRRFVNPDDVDPALLEDEPRLTLIETYLSHPFFHRIQPFNNKTFQQLINFKCITPDEIIERGNRLIDAHVRQGMAFVDLARICREQGRYDDALNYIRMGLLLHNHTGNRLGCYQLEKTIILREAGRTEEAMQVFRSIRVDELDRSNTKLRLEVEASLRG